jgi:hypothetical protein
MVTAVVAQSRYDPRTDGIEALDARLAELARNGAPLRRALARIASAFVERRAWEPLGFARLADYARERPGLSARELFRSAGGSDEPSNLVTLCAAHHQRGVHAGLIRIAGRAPDRLVFELPLGRFRSGDRAA